MKALSMIIGVVVMLTVIGCGKTISELRTDGGAIVDSGSSIVKKAMDAGVAVYDLLKKAWEDTQDDISVVKDIVTGKETVPPPTPPPGQ